MGEELEIIDQPPVHPPAQLEPLADPAGFIKGYSAMATDLARIIDDKKLFVKIGPGRHVRVEGWTLLGSMLGVFPVTIWTRKLDDGWEARVEARTRDGNIVGAAEAECLRSEKRWGSADDYAIRSMAQTRATSKALRQPLGFVISLAGYSPTPAEEMPASEPAQEAADAGMISSAQRGLLFARAKAANVTDKRLRELVEELTGQASTKNIRREQFEQLLELVAADGIPFD